MFFEKTNLWFIDNRLSTITSIGVGNIKKNKAKIIFFYFQHRGKGIDFPPNDL